MNGNARIVVPSSSGVDGNDSHFFNAARLGLLMFILVIGGLTMLYSASSPVVATKYFTRQMIWALAGFLGAGVAIVLDYRTFAKYSLVMVVACFLMLLVTRFCFPKINGAYRWIRIGGFSIQPSEFAKVVLSLALAKYCSENLRTFFKFRGRNGFWPILIIVGMLVGGVLLGQDLGTTMLLLLVAMCIFLVAGAPFWWFLIPLALLPAGFYWIMNHDAERASRITSFLNPEAVADSAGYQLWTGLLALGSGDWLGVGFNAGMMKEKYLPEAHTDFILSVVGEELGYVGIIVVILLYALFIFFGFKVATQAKTHLGMFLATGLTVGIGGQAMINLAVISGSIPTKGMPAPFISYGGTNLIACMTATGLLMSIAIDTARPGYKKHLKEWVISLFRGAKSSNDGEDDGEDNEISEE